MPPFRSLRILNYVLFFLIFLPIQSMALGNMEDPSEVITKEVQLSEIQELEIRGQIDFTITPGLKDSVIVKTSRALLDQMSIFSIWGYGLIAVESGLRGPREIGKVQISVTLKKLNKLIITDHCNGQIKWPQFTKNPQIYISDASKLEMTLTAPELTLESDWKSHISGTGSINQLNLRTKHQSQSDFKQINIESLNLQAEDSSLIIVSNIKKWTGITVRGAKIQWKPDTSGQEKPSGQILDLSY